MDFALDEQRRMLADALGRFIADRCSIAARNAAAGSEPGYDPAIWKQLADLGILAAFVDEAAGGFGGTGVDIMLLFEALGRGLVPGPFLETLMVARCLVGAGGAPDRLEAMLRGDTIVCFAHGEPGGRYGLEHVETRAEPRGEGWAIDGAKAVAGYAGAADLLLVSARTPGGLSLFLVPAGTSGVAIRAYANIDGGRSGEIMLTDVVLPADGLVGSEGGALPIIEAAVAAGLLALSAEALGAMEVSVAVTLDYLRTRVQFGVPIGSFQALQHRMANILIEKEQARSAVINAAAALAGERIARERAASAAKFTIGRVGTLIAEESIQLHGGIGMTWELDLPHYAKRLIMIDHQLGDEDHHLARYVALGRTGA